MTPSRAWLRRNLGFALAVLALTILMVAIITILFLWVLPLPRGGT